MSNRNQANDRKGNADAVNSSTGKPIAHAAGAEGRTDVRQAVLDTVNVQIEAFLGTASMTVGALAQCQPGTLVPLDRTIADLVDLRVNGVAVAKGELVSVKDQFAVRITSIAT